ncbi:hypothetical protein COV23_02515 [Candidatus Wolfebacteria bacterium CG10_big_fil_rev_8_21_14_0_10_31_9]|uniref:Uncharacterized protein n=1 Tax=Candidatus Wolfebacteria bacterium CG10_big_fil_rev_8_21_14_0_10_31_9 TaxID=1975070 RepID=A0A2H0RBN9_9BACT|nr:MAG: hypothetical protein COV23_02515 [Candidatus Wolfebacteria bacterium CG10_big_fil_rev_8_21_14_0_10_31_9]
MKNIIVIHHNDEDGFGGAWVAWKKFKNKADYIAVDFPVPFFDIKNKEIYLIDVCYKKLEMEKLLKNNKKVIAIDHHVSGKEDIKISTDYRYRINNSASVLAWEYFFSNKPIPKLLHYIEDTDLWKFKHKFTKEIIASLDTYKYDFKIWDKISIDLENSKTAKKYIEDGTAIIKYQNSLIKKMVDNGVEVTIDGKRALSVNSPILNSEIGAYIWDNKGVIGLIWYSRNGLVRVSLRSKEGVDVEKIAEKFGGGGHKRASGFSFEYKCNFPWKRIKH